jgi:hypothetical protein
MHWDRFGLAVVLVPTALLLRRIYLLIDNAAHNKEGRSALLFDHALCQRNC